VWKVVNEMFGPSLRF